MMKDPLPAAAENLGKLFWTCPVAEGHPSILLVKLIFLLALLFLPLLAPAAAPSCQRARTLVSDSVTVVDIYLRGHKRTRSSVIFREMSFGKGDRIAAEELEEEIATTYNALMNTGLFARIEISHTDSILGPGLETVFIDINETWYLFPVPVFSLADRNFNVWWRDQNRSIDRVNIGGKLTSRTSGRVASAAIT